MAITSSFFNSINRDRVYDASDFAAYFASFIGNGVFPNPSSGLQVTAGDNMATAIKAGKGWINGYFLTNDSDYVLQHDNSDGVLKRIDRVVMGLNYNNREMTLYIKKGVFSSNPVAPELVRNSEIYELALGDVFINNGSTQISQSFITDQRLNTQLCGIVQGVVNQVDTTTIFNQYQTFFNDYTTQAISDFEEFVRSIEGILDENVAGNLLNMINALQNDKADKSAVGSANGIAPLDSNSKLPYVNLPQIDGLLEKISEVELSSSVASVDLRNLNLQNYGFLRLTIVNAKSGTSSSSTVSIIFNNLQSGYSNRINSANASSQAYASRLSTLAPTSASRNGLVMDIFTDTNNLYTASIRESSTLSIVQGVTSSVFELTSITLNGSMGSGTKIKLEGIKK